MISPAVYGIYSQATIKTKEGNNKLFKGDGQFNLGLGADLGVGYQVCERVNVRLYAGMTYVPGNEIDAMPQVEHESNFLWDGGVKVSLTLGKKKAKSTAEYIAPKVVE